MSGIVIPAVLHALGRIVPGAQNLIEHGVVIAVQHEQAAPGWGLPKEESGPGRDGSPEVRIDRHDEKVDTVVDEHVSEWPRYAVDIELTGGPDGTRCQFFQTCLAFDQPAQAGAIDE